VNENENKLVTKEEGRVWVLLKTSLQIESRKLIENTEFFRVRLHAANVRLRELGDQYTSRHFRAKPGTPITTVIPIFRQSDDLVFKRLSVYNTKALAEEALSHVLQKQTKACIVEVPVLINVPKSEQKRRT